MKKSMKATSQYFGYALSLFLYLFLCINPSFAQSNLWAKSFDKNVNFVKMTDPGVVVVGTDDALYGIDSKGEVIWKNEKLRKVESERVEILTGSELIFVSDKGLLARNRAINVTNGKEYADDGVKFSNIYGATIIPSANQILVLPTPGQVDAWDIKSNTYLWTLGGHFPHGVTVQKSASLTSTFMGNQPIVYTSKTSGIMHLGLGHLANYDFNTGQPLWQFDFKPWKIKKPGNGKGDRPSMPASGYAIMKASPDNSTLYFPFRNELMAIDTKSGQSKWGQKVHKLGGKIKDMYVTDQGILVLLPTGVQLINENTGAAVWGKPIKIKGAIEALLIPDGSDFYTISKKYLMKLDLKKGTAKQLTDKIKFEGGESFTSLEVKGNQIIMSASQNVVGIDKVSGAISYQHYFKAPGASFGNIAANVALAAYSAALSMSSYSSNHNRAAANNQSSFTYTQSMLQIEKDGGSATKGDGNNLYINTKFKESKASGFGLAKIDKSSGELKDKIVIGDRDPVYTVDEARNLIFYRSDKRAIACRKMN